MVSAILTVQLLALRTSAPVAQDPPVLHTAELGIKRELREVNGSAKEVSVSYTVKFKPWVRAEGDSSKDEIRHFREVHVSPESPGQKFLMERKFEQSDLKDDQISMAMEDFVKYGGGADAGKDLFTGIQRVRGFRDRAVKELGSVTIDPNEGIELGGITTRKYGHATYPYECEYEIWESYDDGSKEVTKKVMSAGVQVGMVWEPRQRPYYENFVPRMGVPDKGLQQSLGGITVQPQTMGNPTQIFVPPLAGSWGEYPTWRNPQQYVGDVIKENGEKIVDDMKDMGLTIPQMVDLLKQIAPQGTSMNQLNFPVREDPCSTDFDAPPGLVWVPSDGSYQTMMTGVRFNVRDLSFDLWAMDGGSFAQNDPRAMRVLCMNMEKKEPAAGVMYFPYRPNNPVIQALAQRMDESNFRGAWDQARMWIYTDRASLKDINEKLMNGVSHSGYLMALADVDWAGGLDEAMLKDARIIDPVLLLGSGAPQYAQQFFMNALDEYQPKKAGEWLRKNVATMLQLVGPQSDEDDHAFFARTLQRMTTFTAPEDREAALKFIQATQGEISILKGKLGAGRVSLYSGRNEEVTVALALVKSGFLKPAKDALAYVAEHGPGDANKALAKELMGATNQEGKQEKTD